MERRSLPLAVMVCWSNWVTVDQNWSTLINFDQCWFKKKLSKHQKCVDSLLTVLIAIDGFDSLDWAWQFWSIKKSKTVKSNQNWFLIPWVDSKKSIWANKIANASFPYTPSLRPQNKPKADLLISAKGEHHDERKQKQRKCVSHIAHTYHGHSRKLIQQQHLKEEVIGKVF